MLRLIAPRPFNHEDLSNPGSFRFTLSVYRKSRIYFLIGGVKACEVERQRDSQTNRHVAGRLRVA